MLYTYFLNGIDLDNNAMGSHLNDDAKPFPGLSPRVSSFSSAGRDGNVTVPQSDDSPFLVLGISVPHENVEALMMALRLSSLRGRAMSRERSETGRSPRRRGAAGGRCHRCGRDSPGATASATA